MATTMIWLKRKRSLDEMEDTTTLKRIKRTPEEIENIILHNIIPPGVRIDFKSQEAPVVHPPGFIEELYVDLRDNVVGVSALGNFERPLKAFLSLIKIPKGAMALMDHLSGLSDLNGREIEMRSVFGAFLHVSGLPDHGAFPSLPQVGLHDVRTRMDKLQCSLADALKTLLNMNEGIHRENVLQFLALLIKKNASRAHILVDPLSCASLGTFVNLSAIMLRLCKPFLDDPTKRNRIDPMYVFNGRLELRCLTAIHATSDQVSGWTCKSEQEFDFTCECFFMTARVLNLGLMQFLSDYKHHVETKITSENRLKTVREALPSPPPSLQQSIARAEKIIESYSQKVSCYETRILEEKWLIERAIPFYKVMVVWMVDLAGGFKIPACPVNFAAIPEHFVDDAMELLIFASEHKPLDIEIEDADFMNFIIMFMGSPEFIQNPYLRTKMVKVLYSWIPNQRVNKLLKGHQPALDYLVRNLLKLYVDSKSTTGSHSQFNEDHTILEVLKYLWEIPGHRNAWKRIAKEEEKGVYVQFLNILMNDSIHTLDEGLNTIVKPNKYIEMICFITEEIVAPFLLPEMVARVASTLSYFLARLLISPAQNDLHKYELLRLIVKIYVNLARVNRENVFATAITKDGRSYNDHNQLFGDAAQELKKYGEEKMINEFMELGRKAKVITKQTEEAELALGEIPEEFMDPIMSTLMTDPVIIPTTNVRIDRPVILRHLLTKNTDPFSGLPLTADMLIPDAELKAQIDHFLQK